MGIISLEQQDQLYWLGRYTERVFTTTDIFEKCFDLMIDQNDESWVTFCESLEIPNIYTSREDFIKRYGFDEQNPDSLVSNLLRGYDNAIILRETIGSTALSYIQLAVYDMRRAAMSDAPVLELQKVTDHIAAFWGISDDSIEEDIVRDLIRTGRRVERVDLYARLHIDDEKMTGAIRRLTAYRLIQNSLASSPHVQKLNHFLESQNMNYSGIIYEVEHLFEVQ